MKKSLFLFSLTLLLLQSKSQIISFSQKLDGAFQSNIKNDFSTAASGITSYDSLRKIFIKKRNDFFDSLKVRSIDAFAGASISNTKNLVNKLRSRYSDSLDKYEYLYYYVNNVQKVNMHISGNPYKKDTLWKKKPVFRRYAYESVRFFENDTSQLNFFKNNTVNYSPTTKEMSLYTEVLSDYFAAFRIGIGFQVKTNSPADSVNISDSAKKVLTKDELVGNLQNQAGGNFNVNVSYPLAKNKTELAWINYRIYFYSNLGVSLPFLNKRSSDFVLNSDIGLQGTFYSNGFNEKITLFGSFKCAQYFGNAQYRKIITDAAKDNPTSFLLTKTSIGLAFMDGYRISFDLYPHFGNQFIKNNFPATISFTIRPGDTKK